MDLCAEIEQYSGTSARWLPNKDPLSTKYLKGKKQFYSQDIYLGTSDLWIYDGMFALFSSCIFSLILCLPLISYFNYAWLDWGGTLSDHDFMLYFLLLSNLNDFFYKITFEIGMGTYSSGVILADTTVGHGTKYEEAFYLEVYPLTSWPTLDPYWLHYKSHALLIHRTYSDLIISTNFAELYKDPYLSRFDHPSFWVTVSRYVADFKINGFVGIKSFFVVLYEYLIGNYGSMSLICIQVSKVLFWSCIFIIGILKYILRFWLFSEKKILHKERLVYEINSLIYIKNFFRSNKVKWARYINKIKKF